MSLSIRIALAGCVVLVAALPVSTAHAQMHAQTRAPAAASPSHPAALKPPLAWGLTQPLTSHQTRRLGMPSPFGLPVVHPADRRSPARAFLVSLGATSGAVVGGLGLSYVGRELVRQDPGSPYAETALTSAGGTLTGVGVALIAGGIIAGPSMGHMYARRTRRGYVGITARSITTGVGTLASGVVLVDVLGDVLVDVLVPFPPREDVSLSRTGRIARDVALGAFATTLGLGAFDILTAPLSARRHNRAQPHRIQRASTRTLRLYIVPPVHPGRLQMGLGGRLVW